MSENQNVDQKWRFFPKKLHAANGIFLKSIRRKPAGTWHHSPDTVLGKEAPQGHLMGRMGNSAGELFGWEHLGILECFLLFFLTPFFPPHLLAYFGNGCQWFSNVFLGAKPLATSPQISQTPFCCSIKVSVWGFTVLSPYNYFSKGESSPLRPNVCGAKPRGGVEASGCSITSVPISLRWRPGLLTPCQAPQSLIHLIPGKNLSKLMGFATQKVTCLVSPWGIPLLFGELVCIWRWKKMGRKKRKSKWFAWFPSSPEGD